MFPSHDPRPEIIRLGDRIRGDYNAFGADQDARNTQVLREIREQTAEQAAQAADIRARQETANQTIREAVMRQDVINQEFQERLGLGEAAMSDARDAVVQEIRDAEERLRGAARDLDRPTSYDDIILRAAQRESQQLPEITPSPSVARPSNPIVTGKLSS